MRLTNDDIPVCFTETVQLHFSRSTRRVFYVRVRVETVSESFQRMGLLYHQAHFKLPPSVSTASAFVKPFAIFVHSVVHVLAAL